MAQDNSGVKFSVANSSKPGICYEIAKEIEKIDPTLALEGLEKSLPIARIESNLESKDIDVFFCLLKSMERLKRFSFIETPLYNVKHVLLVKADDNIDIKNYADIKKLGKENVVLVNQGSTLVKTLDAEGITAFTGAKENAQVLNLLDAGKGRFFYVQDYAIINYLKENKLESKYKILPAFFKEEPQLIAYRKDLDPVIVEKLRVAINSLGASGVLEKIASKYR